MNAADAGVGFPNVCNGTIRSGRQVMECMLGAAILRSPGGVEPFRTLSPRNGCKPMCGGTPIWPTATLSLVGSDSIRSGWSDQGRGVGGLSAVPIWNPIEGLWDRQVAGAGEDINEFWVHHPGLPVGSQGVGPTLGLLEPVRYGIGHYS